MNVEIWKHVDNTPYEVSSFGNVRRGARLLKARRHSNGYTRVSFSIGGVHTDKYVHRLVCTAFHGPAPSALHHADHKDCRRDHNHETNLQWLTPEDNRSRRVFGIGEDASRSKLSLDQVNHIRSMPFARGQDGRIAAAFGVSREQVRDIRLGKSWRASS